MRTLVISLLLAVSALAAPRYNSFLYGVAYYPEHWQESAWERDARLMQEAGVNTVRIGEFAWYLMEPKRASSSSVCLTEPSPSWPNTVSKPSSARPPPRLRNG